MARARARKAENPWSTGARDDSLDTMFREMHAQASEALGRDDISIGSEADKVMLGLPFRYLSQRYLYQSNVMPLGRVVQLAGLPGSGKSAMLDDIILHHMQYGGGAFVAETEDKDAPTMRNGMLGWRQNWINRVIVGPANIMEEWQAFLLTSWKAAQGKMDAEGGPGRTVPICFGVDSLTAVANRSQIEKTEEAGFSSLGYASVANLISRFASETFSKNLRGYPFTIAATNHIKPGTDQQGRPTKNIPGGKAVPFRATFLLEMAMWDDISTLDYEGIKVRIKMAKNSVGTSRREVVVNLLWRNEDDGTGTGQYRQQFWWDWSAATIDMLLAFEKMSAKKTLFNLLMELVDLHPVSGRRVWSHALDIPKDDPVSYSEAGTLLEQHPEIVSAVHPLLGVNNYAIFQPGMDYRQAYESAKQAGSLAPPVTVEADGEDADTREE